MDARADGVPCQSARSADLVVAKPRHFSHEEYVTVEVGQCGQSLVDCEIDILRRWSRAFVRQHRWLGLSNTLAVVIEREVPCDLKQPSPDLTVRSHWDRGPAHPQEDVLRQITRGIGFAYRSAEVLEQAMLVSGEQRFGVDRHASLLLRTPRGGDPLDGHSVNPYAVPPGWTPRSPSK